MSEPEIKRRLLRDLSINRKMILMVSVVAAICALVIGGALLTFQLLNLRNQFKYQVVSVSEVAASFASAPVAFGDELGAVEVLSALKANEDITLAQIRFRSGEVFAQFGDDSSVKMVIPQNNYTGFDGWTLYVVRGVLVPNQSYVWLVVTADFRRSFYSTVTTMGVAILGVLVAGVLISMLATSIFRNSIIGPILRLADVARDVAEGQNYSLRAKVESLDEVGSLSANFNNMLSRIEDVDLEVRAAYTELENESREREKLQDDLVKTSRMAGMAEVATGVLHNVGNVLNTVNLSVHGVQERLMASRLEHLRAAVDTINAENGNLAEFLTNDPRGKAITPFIGKVVDHLESENEKMRKDMSSLIGHVDHIKEIVATQQSHARVLGVTEVLSPSALVEDAIKLNQSSLSRHNVNLTREFADVPEVLVDRHKAVQILVNLITNAKDAMREQSPTERNLVVGIKLQEDDLVEISIKDSGTGIKPESLSNIFTHGFTTKVDGHGFGLHTSALSAQEMGGSLRVDSEGMGKGATFTLSLPIKTITKVS